ncbi:hypothetical protein SK803_17480 [Lentzea sp. BCCO 10_0856]|uniref:Uncharacterized protein n=1 Tax=Lentzea miocenica TaxID=3095431 RepID=A0ABU4T1P3_9PSEU|nr:hypothetical protein [Lentzea sp. BCCO 10_0856]MDX8032020.1 hypothetical protein [Lentzea sp. BCCO 10_0856]
MRAYGFVPGGTTTGGPITAEMPSVAFAAGAAPAGQTPLPGIDVPASAGTRQVRP